MKQQRIETRVSGVAEASKTNDLIDISSLIRTVWRGKWIIAAFAIIMVFVGGYYAYVTATPLYRAASVIILEPKQEQIVSFESVVAGMSGDDAEVNSEVEVLKSRELAKRVVDKLGLLDDPEFNGSLREQSFAEKVKSTIRSMLPMPSQTAEGAGTEARERAILESTVSAVLSKVTIQNVPDTYVLRITAETESANKSARLADAVADQYILDQIDAKYEATEQASSWLSDRVTVLQGELEDAESQLSDFSSRTALISPEDLALKERQIKDLRDRIASLTETVSQKDALIAALLNATDRQAITDIAGDAELSRLARQLEQVPDNASIAERFDSRAATVLRNAQADAVRSRSQIQILENSRDTMLEEYDAQSQDLIRLQQLTREAEASRLLYEYFLSRLKETSVQQGIQKADARVLSYGVVPVVPSSPKKSRILAMSGLFGILLGSGLVVLREARKTTFRTAQDLELQSGYSVLGQVPLFPTKARNRVLAYLKEKPNSAAAEAVRNFRTSILLSNVDSPPRVVMMTSAVPGEGKTTLSLALANNFAGMGRKVLVIEGDIRRLVFTRYLRERGTSAPGLISVLDGSANIDDAIVHDENVGVDVLPGQATAINAGDLFSSKKFGDLIQALRERYDTIVIDTPPVLVVPDARVIAQHADATFVVVGWDSTEHEQVLDTIHQLEMVNCRPSGLVLNQINSVKMRGYGYGSRYGAYASYGSKYYVN